MAFDFAYPNARPDARGWGPGYPNCAEEAWVPLVAANGVGFGRVHKNIHTLLELILAECIRRSYPPKAGQCWGAVCRCSHRSDGTCAEDANGNPVPSNHSWGLAIDYNSIDNPYGADREDSQLGGNPKLGWVPILFREYGFRWLGPPIDDWQHFDFAGEPTDAVTMTVKARSELGDDMSTQDMREGGAAFRNGKPIPADANADFKYGYNIEKRIDAASKTPLPGVPAPHEHNLQGKAT
jgi:hypothetical protein